VTHNTIVALAVLGVAGQVAALVFVLVVLIARLGIPEPLHALRSGLWGYELWVAFVVSSIATGGSLFFSEIAGFVPCELCWYQRICMYPLSIITLLAAIRGDFGVARYLLPLPLVGACVSVYHLLVENGVVAQSTECLVSAPGGCATKWINEFGYMTIPTLALTAFVLLIELLGLATVGNDEPGSTVNAHAKR
jgi:disulfide bond formation protein DsbB